MENYNYNAPQYIDFTSAEDLELKDYGEEYFEIDHEIEINQSEVQYHEEQINKIHEENNAVQTESINNIKSENQCDQKEIIEISDESNSEEMEPVNDFKKKSKIRRSVSAGHIIIPHTNNENCDLSSALQKLQLSTTSGQNKNISQQKTNLRKIKSNSNLNKYTQQKSISRDSVNKIGLSKRKISVENLQPSKYISVAEAINKFQFGTPQRYHTKSSKAQFNNKKITALLKTIPHSPMLATKSRIRATTCISHEKQEEIEMEEMKKHKIKPQPINYKILQAPVNVKYVKRPATVPEPFKLTEMKIHNPTKIPGNEVYEFHARPVPKSTAVTPCYLRKHRETMLKVQDNHSNENVNVKPVDMCYDGVKKKIQKLQKTTVQPFSFEERDRLKQQRKEDKIKKILEEEKKQREFHARPLPNKIAASLETKIGTSSSTSSLNSNKNDENAEPNKTTFKARPATVIHKKPFIPEKKERPLVEIAEFNLNTIKRAKEREEFDKGLKEKEEKIENLKREFTEKQKQLEMMELNKLRKELVHTALPIKQYKQVAIQPSNKKLTSPISPNLSKKRVTQLEK